MKDLWNIIGAIAGVLAVAITVFVFLQDRSDKTQRIEITQVSRTTLVNPELSSPSRRVEILYNGRKVSDYAVFQFRVSNVGGQPIRGADYEVPLGVALSNIEEILWTEMTAADPAPLRIEASIKAKTVEMSSTLLNPKDWYMVEVAVVPEHGKLPIADPLGRVAGVKKIEFVQSVPIAGDTKGNKTLKQILMLVQGVLVVLMLGLQYMRRRRYG